MSHIRTTLSILALTLSATTTQAEDLDVYARDMSFEETSKWSNINWVGHLGIEKDSKIFNMLPSISPIKTSLGQDNYMHRTEIQDFKNEGDNFWGVKYEDSTANDWKIHDYLNIIRHVGAVYSIRSNDNYNPYMIYNKRTKTYVYVRGKLRCDVLVRRALMQAGHKKSSLVTPGYVYDNIKNNRWQH